MTDITEKLRAEINISKKNRHDFVLRKFSTITILLGAGSLRKIDALQSIGIDFAPLLFLVPLIAIAFDMYILGEDFRIKRAGEFIRRHPKIIAENESEWEEYCSERTNWVAASSPGFVTLISLMIATVLLIQSDYSTYILPWSIVVVVLLLGATIAGFKFRKWLEIKDAEIDA